MSAKWITEFQTRLDELLGLISGSSKTDDAQTNGALQAADMLSRLDFDSEIAPRAEIQSRWEQQTRTLNWSSWLPRFRFAWTTILLIFLILLVAFRQPVFAGVSRALGYIYIADIGFLPMDSTFVLQQPIRQEHAGQTVTVARGIGTPETITLYLEFNDIARPIDGAHLETTLGEKLKLLGWEYWPNLPNSRGIKVIFPPLPLDITQTTLSLPEGWHLLLEWIPASQSNLADTRVVPYVSQTALPAPSELCIEKPEIDLCVLAATTSSENTSILVKPESKNPVLVPGDMTGFLTWQTENAQVTLQDEQGNVLPISNEQNGTLTFPPLPPGQRVTLTIPTLLAMVDIPDQNIVVDLGDDPQPDTIIPLDATIEVLNTTIHFSQATFVGDGITGLRLMLNADDTIQTVDGITPISFELGKPDRVDDLYGGGMFDGSKDIFIELIRQHEKITGVLTIPILRATVTIDGPFEFTFNLTNASSPTPMPAEADPSTFSPAPTPTPLPLNGYSYTGENLKSGDLVFTIFNGKNSDLYAFTPEIDSQPRLIATLPGAVEQIYVQPDYQGLDYLAGMQTSKDGVSYIKDLSLYTISFNEVTPLLLYTFPPTPKNVVGPTVYGDWSYDSKYAIFRYVYPTPGNDYSKYLWMDMTCRQNGHCLANEILFEQNLELSIGDFAPGDYRILFTGSDNSGTGEMDLFIMDFDPNDPTQSVVNITANSSDSVDDVAAQGVWIPDGTIFTLCNDGRETNRFCYVDPVTGQITGDAIYSEHISEYQMSPSGQSILGIVINHNAAGKGFNEIHRFDLNARAGPTLATGRLIPFAAISPSDRFIAHTTENNDQVQMIDTLAGSTVTFTSNTMPNAVTWLAWID
jgi:hypothetical protein